MSGDLANPSGDWTWWCTGPYLPDTLNAEFGEHGPPFTLAESYAASEGYIAYGDPMLGGALQVICHNGIFYEFIPVEEKDKDTPTRLLADEVVEGRDYIVVLTTTSGLWSHIIGDIIKFTDAKHKTLEVIGRAWGSIEVWNEHAGESDIDGAFDALSREHGLVFELSRWSPCISTICLRRGSYRFIFELEDGSASASSEIGFKRF